MIRNAMSIDVEDYFQVSAFTPHISRDDWDRRECRIERNVDRILFLLAENGTKATFFCLGWIAERYPRVVSEIVTEGHEIASHGYGHDRVSDLTPRQFLRDIQKSKGILENLTGEAVRGYRAPSFSIDESNLWAFDCLARAGYQYSSSVYPIRHDHYGMPSAPRFVHLTATGLLEIPISTLRVFGRNVPASGGGYFRLFPYQFSNWLFSKINVDERRAVVFYFHPWEIDPHQPRIAGISCKSRFRHYVNLDRMEFKLAMLLRDFSWGRMDDVFLSGGRSAAVRPETVA